MHILVEDKDRDVKLDVIVEGEGPDVILLASALRGARDFAQLQSDLAAAGFRSLAVNMRGTERSVGPRDPSMNDLVDDIAGVIESLCGGGPVHLFGHALGNVFVRATASFRPELVRTVTVAPAGGHNLDVAPVSSHVLHHFARCHDSSMSPEDRIESLGIAFFAPGNDASVWLDGWWPESSTPQALYASDPQSWWPAGDAPLLVFQPLQDPMAAPSVGLGMASALGDRVTYVELPNCGHAILPEQPELIARHLIAFLRSHS